MRAAVAPAERAASRARSSARWLDAAGAALVVAAVAWTVVAGVVSGGAPGPIMVMFLLTGAIVLACRWVPVERRWMIPAAIVAVSFLMVPLWLRGTITGSERPFGYANANGAFFIQAVVAAVLLGSFHRAPWAKFGAVAGVAMFGAAAVFSSMAAAATLVLVLGAAAAASRPRLVAAAGAVLLIGVLATTVVIADREAESGAVDPSVQRALSGRRVDLWSEALTLMRTHPGFGVGPGRFSQESPTAMTDEDALWTHHEFLQLGAELGVAGFVLLLLMFLWGLARLWVVPGPGAAVVAAGLVALGIQSSVDYVLRFPAVPLAAAALLGVAAADGRRRPGPRSTQAPFLRRAAKAAVLPMGVATRRRPGDVVVLLYHRVGDGRHEIELSASAFDLQLAELAARERVLTLDEVINDGGGGGIAVTFDDGYRDFHERALPLLVKHRVPAVLYLASGLVAGETAAPNGDAITWTQLQEAASTGLVTIGAHTHSHIDLSRADERLAEEEMRRSQELIEDRVGVPCRHFAYPFAVGSSGADRVARRLFDSAALDAWRTNRRGRIDPHRLGRVPVLRSDGQVFFRAKVRGLLDGEALAYRVLGRGPWRRI
jgi:peptidoglycan/xylan/chitin deacetylase (PgdA/CDA1 family)/O-antigen ligase